MSDRTEFGRYTETMRTIAEIYDIGRAIWLHQKRSEAAKRGWVTRRANRESKRA